MRLGQFKEMRVVQIKIVIVREAGGGKNFQDERVADLAVAGGGLEARFVETVPDRCGVSVGGAVNDVEFHFKLRGSLRRNRRRAQACFDSIGLFGDEKNDPQRSCARNWRGVRISIPNGFSKTSKSLSLEIMIFDPLARAHARNGSSSGSRLRCLPTGAGS